MVPSGILGSYNISSVDLPKKPIIYFLVDENISVVLKNLYFKCKENNKKCMDDAWIEKLS